MTAAAAMAAAAAAAALDRMYWIGGSKPADLRSRSVEVPTDVRAIYLHRGAARQVVRLGIAPSISGAAEEDMILASEGYRSSEERARTPGGTSQRSPSAQSPDDGRGGRGHRRVQSTNTFLLDISSSSPTPPTAAVPAAARTASSDNAGSPEPGIPVVPPPLMSRSVEAPGGWLRPISWSGTFRLPALPWPGRLRQTASEDDSSASASRPASNVSTTSTRTTASGLGAPTETRGPSGSVRSLGSADPAAADDVGAPETVATLAAALVGSPSAAGTSSALPVREPSHATPMSRARMSMLSRSHPDLPLPEPGALAPPTETDSAASPAMPAAHEVEAPAATDYSQATIREGELLVLRPDHHEWRRQLAVLSTESLALFPTKGGSGHVIAMTSIANINLRAETDNAIELTVVDDGTYTLQAETRLGSEEWIHDILRTLPLTVIAKKPCATGLRASTVPQVIPTHVSVDVPFNDATAEVPASVTTTAEQLLQQLSLQRNADYFRSWCLCLRRGDHLTWLEPDDLVITLPVVFKVRRRTTWPRAPSRLLTLLPPPAWSGHGGWRTGQSHRLQCHRLVDRQHASAAAARPPDVEGYLTKHGADGRLGGWKRRFFFTRDRHLFYAKAHNARSGEPACTSTDTVGVIPLEDVLSIEGDAIHADQFNVTIVNRVYRLRAQTPEDMVLWVGSLRRLREYYQSVLANSYRKQMRWGYIPSAATAAKRQGFLYKRGQLNRSWKKRLVILVSGHLCYFTADDGAKHLRGKIALTHAAVALAPNEAAPHAFQIITPERTYVLRAETQPDMEQWMAAIDQEKLAVVEASLGHLALGQGEPPS